MSSKNKSTPTHAERAANYREEWFSCSQSVFAAYAPDFGISADTGLKIATPFGAGMGKQQYTCGAVTGALMVLGLKFGMGENDPAENKSLTYSKTLEFMEEFKRINGSISCLELLDGLNMNDPADYQQMLDQKMFINRCNKYVDDAVKILNKILEN